MTVRPIVITGEPVLHRRALPVESFDGDLRELVADMFDTMDAAHGVGLAAPQIGVGLRVFTYWVDGVLGHLVNPSLDLSEEEQDGPEGCLSIPGVAFDTKRALSVVARGQNMWGEPVVLEGTELLARCVQHETDHLNGVLFLDRLDPESRREAMRAIRESDWFAQSPTEVRISPHSTFGRAM